MRCENGTRFYIDDFVEDLNYRKIILSFGDVDPEKLKSKLEKDNLVIYLVLIDIVYLINYSLLRIVICRKLTRRWNHQKYMETVFSILL